MHAVTWFVGTGKSFLYRIRSIKITHRYPLHLYPASIFMLGPKLHRLHLVIASLFRGLFQTLCNNGEGYELLVVLRQILHLNGYNCPQCCAFYYWCNQTILLAIVLDLKKVTEDF